MRAENLITTIQSNNNLIEIFYQIDQDFKGKISFRFPFEIVIDQATLSIIGLWVSCFLGQLCLTKNIELNFPVNKEMINDIIPIIMSMYDVRCYRDKYPLCDIPTISSRFPFENFTVRGVQLQHRKACALLSGGKDSTLTVLALQKNGYEIVPIHFANANVEIAEPERDAVNKLASELKITPYVIQMEFNEFVEIATRYSKVIHRRPFDNSIPHGRELLLLGPTLLMAKYFDSSCICIGSDHGRNAKVLYEGKSIWRWDTASDEISNAIENFISNHLDLRIMIFPPLATLSDFGRFSLLLKAHPNVLKKTTSCHFEKWCGECTKCVRYYLYQRVLGASIISFEHDPLEENNWFLREFIANWRNQDFNHWADLHYCLYSIVKKEGESQSSILREYKNTVFAHIEKDMPAIMERVLEVSQESHFPEGWIDNI